MLPDFPDVKRFVDKTIGRVMRQEIIAAEPILAQIRHQAIHEGHSASITRADASTDQFDFKKISAEIAVPVDQMRRMTPEQLLDLVRAMARQFADQQAQHMFETMRRVISEAGNEVAVGPKGEKEAFLEMERRRQAEFDPDTLEPVAPTLVLHPDQVESFAAQFEEWNRDPEFVAERDRIREAKLGEWRARQDRRKLVD